MMNKKKIFVGFFCLFLFFVNFSVFAEKLDERIFYKEKNVVSSLVPESNISSEVVSFWKTKYKKSPVFFAETLYKIPSNGKSIQEISEILRSFSSMEGIKYYSNSKNRIEVLYDYCKTISDLKTKSPIADDTSENANGKTIYMIQNDTSFGKTPYEVKYWQTENVIAFNAVNKGPLYAGIIKAVKDEGVCFTILVKEEAENLYVYIMAQADFTPFPMVDKMIRNSFSARIEALHNWFIGMYDEN